MFNNKPTNFISTHHNTVKGLLVGINYRGTRNELGGCINDVLTVKKLIKAAYPNAELELLTDDTVEKPTRDNILTKLTTLVANARAGDTILFDYSGHGSQVQDLHGDEEDGLDETICPIDFTKTRVVHYQGKKLVLDSQITDDEINEIISDMPHGSRFLMLSDSCHSGTIGDLSNDFAHYQGPNVWPNDQSSAAYQGLNQTTPNYGANFINNTPINPVISPSVSTLAVWVFVKTTEREELWITPYDQNLLGGADQKKFIVPVNNNYAMVGKLLYYPNSNKTVNTQFNRLSNGDYKVSAAALEINNIIVANNKNKFSINQINVYNSASTSENQQPSKQKPEHGNFNVSHGLEHVINWLLPNRSTTEVISYHDPKTGRHHHFNHITGKKRSLKMRSPNCKGGELRVISGCRENETSADTGINGACTMAFIDTVKYVGGLVNFLEKIFSHNVADFRLIENTINKYLAKFGFSQYSVFSWDHSSSARELTDLININKTNINNAASRGCSTARNIIPESLITYTPMSDAIIYRSPVAKEQVNQYVENAVSSARRYTDNQLSDAEIESKISQYRKVRNVTM